MIQHPEPFRGDLTPDAIQAQIEAWQPLLGLVDWDIRYVPGDPPPDSRSHFDGWLIKRMGVIRIHPKVPESQVDRQIVHELLHAWSGQLQDVMKPLMDFTPTYVDRHAESAWDRVEHQLIEVLVDALTGVPRAEWDAEDIWRRAWPVSA